MCNTDVILYDWIDLTNATKIDIYIPEFYTNEKYMHSKCRFLSNSGIIVPVRFGNLNKTMQLICGKNNNTSDIYISYSGWGGANYANALIHGTYTQSELIEFTSIYNSVRFDASIKVDGVLMPISYYSNYNVQPFRIEFVEVRRAPCKLCNFEVDGIINLIPAQKGLETGVYDTLSHTFYPMEGVIVGND